MVLPRAPRFRAAGGMVVAAALVFALLALPAAAGDPPSSVGGVPLVRTRETVILNPGPGPGGPTTPPANQRSAAADTLAAALDLTAWAEQGRALLVVDAENTRPKVAQPRPGEPLMPPPAPLTPGPSGKLALRDVAAHFNRKIVRAGDLTVLAPTTMVVLNTKPGPPDLFGTLPQEGSLSQQEKMRLLFASLSTAQWRRLGSPKGLGAGDMTTPAQRNLFLSVLPDPFTFQKQFVWRQDNIPSDERGYGSNHPDYGPSLATRTTLTPGQRAGVRLRLSRRTSVYVPVPDKPNSFHVLDTARERAEGSEYLTLMSEWPREQPSEYNWQPSEYNWDAAFGATLRQEVRSRAKPGHLPFDAPPLAGAVTLPGAAAVGDLVRRCGEATGLELYADPRLARLSVRTIGASARAGDVVEALTLAVTGTFRRLGPDENGRFAYVLTDDIAGIGARRALLADWVNDARYLQSQQMMALRKQIAARQPGQYLRFRDDDPFVLPPSLQTQVEEVLRDPKGSYGSGGRGAPINITDLPPVYQKMIAVPDSERSYQAVRLYGPLSFPREGLVGIEVRPRLDFLVPGVGVVESDSWFGFARGGNLDDLLAPEYTPEALTPSNDPQPIALPAAALPERALQVALPANAQTARQIAREAKRRGLTHLWVVLPAPEAGDTAAPLAPDLKERLADVVQVGKENGLAVLAVVRLLRCQQPAPPAKTVNAPDAARAPDAASPPPAAAAAPTDDWADRNVLGESLTIWARRRANSAVAQFGDGENLRAGLLRNADAGDWRRIDRLDAAASLKRYLLEVAAVSGLAGLVLREVTATGYEAPGDNNWGASYSGVQADFGYTPEMRLAFLRQTGADPIDLSSRTNVGNVRLELPFFRAEPSNVRVVGADGVPRPPVNPTKTPDQQWRTFRYETNVALLRDLYAALRAERPDLPVLVGERAGANLYASWDKPDALPTNRPQFTRGIPLHLASGPSPLQQARQTSRRVLFPVLFPVFSVGDVDAPAFADRLRDSLEYQMRNNRWEGIVLDLSSAPPDKVLPLLDALAATTP